MTVTYKGNHMIINKNMNINNDVKTHINLEHILAKIKLNIRLNVNKQKLILTVN